MSGHEDCNECQAEIECSSITEVPSITKVITEVKCKPPKHGRVAYYDSYSDGVPPNSFEDMLFITPGVFQDSADMFLERVWRHDLQFIYTCIIILNILFLLSAIFGITSSWYNNLKKDNISPYLIGALWLVAAVMAYGSIFMLWEHVKPEDVSKDIRISIYFLIGTFLSVLWAGVFFQGHDLRWSLWLSAVLFLYSFWLLIYIWLMKPTAGIFMLPLVVMYGYFFYASVHVAFLNNTPI